MAATGYSTMTNNLVRCEVVYDEVLELYVMKRDWPQHDSEPGLVYLPKAMIDRWERASHELRCAVDAIRSYMTEFYNG